VIVRCGKSGTLRTKFTNLAAEPEMSLEAASIAMCARAPARVMAKYKTELVTLREAGRDLCEVLKPRGELSVARSCESFGRLR
jgi:hypothetical protein